MGVTVIELANFAVVLIGSTAAHEMAHARLAHRFGDPTPEQHGRITWNPWPHLDPVMSVAVPCILFWISNGSAFLAAAWTPVSPFRMRKPRVHSLLTALGGPAVNLVLMILGVFLMAPALAFDLGAWILHPLILLFKINAFLFVFNLFPVPPLDGSAIIEALAPRSWMPALLQLRRFGFFILLGLWFLGVLDVTVFPAMDWMANRAFDAAVALSEVLGG